MTDRFELFPTRDNRQSVIQIEEHEGTGLVEINVRMQHGPDLDDALVMLNLPELRAVYDHIARILSERNAWAAPTEKTTAPETDWMRAMAERDTLHRNVFIAQLAASCTAGETREGIDADQVAMRALMVAEAIAKRCGL